MVLVLRFLRLEFNVTFWLSGISHIKCCSYLMKAIATFAETDNYQYSTQIIPESEILL
jgi:hypothetical protein